MQGDLKTETVIKKQIENTKREEKKMREKREKLEEFFQKPSVGINFGYQNFYQKNLEPENPQFNWYTLL